VPADGDGDGLLWFSTEAALLGFLRDVSEPYLRIFRRFIPPIGPLDLSPMIALFVLYIVGGIVASAIQG